MLHDVHHRLTPIEAARLARDLEPFRLFWLEDATPAENQQAFEVIRRHSVTPLAVGEVFNSIWDCKHLIEAQLIDYIRTTIVHDYRFEAGRLHCGERPGHGVELDEKLAARFPYSPKQLPIARLEDGSMWDW